MQSSSPEQQPGQDKRSARRRLLKGSFAVPAALTLASGTAFAAGTNALRCVRASAAVPDSPSPASFGSDTLVRVQGYTTLGGPNAYTFIKGSEVAAKLGTTSGTLLVMGANSVPLTAANILCVVGQTKVPPDRVQNNVYDAPSSAANGTGTYYAILVNATGDIVGISTGSTVVGGVGGAVSNVCWQSFGGLV